MYRITWLYLALASLSIASACSSDALIARMAIRSAAAKAPAPSSTDLAAHAKSKFRDALYEADYEGNDRAQFLLTAAYLENPRDPEIALLLAHSHLWQLSERTRLTQSDPQITDHALLADHYFGEAHTLAPEDDRIHGWRGAVRMTLGSINDNEALKRRGYFQLREGARAYPEFNAFSAGYPLGGLPRDGKRFAEGVEFMWQNLEACGGEDFNRANFSYVDVMASQTDQGPERACWSTALVPHNFEGFFLTMGDMLTKSGDVENARRAYETAKLTPSYSTWRYASILDARLEHLDARARQFASAATVEEEPEMMFRSSYSCTGCHAK